MITAVKNGAKLITHNSNYIDIPHVISYHSSRGFFVNSRFEFLFPLTRKNVNEEFIPVAFIVSMLGGLLL